MVLVDLSDDNISYGHGHAGMYVFSRSIFIHSRFYCFTVAYSVKVFQNCTSNFFFSNLLLWFECFPLKSCMQSAQRQ